MSDRHEQAALVIEGWKAWHRQVADILGCEHVARDITVQAIRDLQAKADGARDAALLEAIAAVDGLDALETASPMHIQAVARSEVRWAIERLMEGEGD